MEARLVDIVEILCPTGFYVRETSSLCNEEEERISEDIKTFIENSAENSNDPLGRESVCCVKSDGKYLRVIIENTDGYLARCRFLDSKLRTTILPVSSLRRLNHELIERRRLVKLVWLKGTPPHFIMIGHDQEFRFGQDYNRDDCVFVDKLIGGSDSWLCVFESGSYEHPTSFEARLYYTIKNDPRERVQQPSSGSKMERVVFTEKHVDPEETVGTVIHTCTILDWTEEMNKKMWFSFNQAYVRQKFPVLKKTRIDNFVLHLITTQPHEAKNCNNEQELTDSIFEASPFDDIWVDSYKTIYPNVELDKINFFDTSKDDKKLLALSSQQTSLQSHSWASIVNLMDFVGIGPASTPSRCPNDPLLTLGQTESYILPILWQLNNTDYYKYLPDRCHAPIVLVLCPSSKSVWEAYKTIQTLLSHQKDLANHRIDLTAAFMYNKFEKEKQLSVAKNSQILIITPNSLLRMLESNQLSFDRLCHLVCEDADLLIEFFQTQMKRIVDGFRLAAMDKKYGGTPNQILVFSKKWTPSLDDFVVANLTDPTVAMTSIMEAFYSGNVKTEANWCSGYSKNQVLLQILRERLCNDDRKEKVVVLCSTDEEARQIHKELMDHIKGQCKMLLVCDSLDEKEILFNVESVACKEEDDIILVTSDEMLKHISTLSNATCVIHRDVPLMWQVLASRLWLMRDCYQKTSERKAERCSVKVNSHSVKSPCTHVLLSEEDADPLLIRMLSTFFRRAGEVNLPREIFEVGSGTDNYSMLCLNFKSFGFCMNQLYCKTRHFFSEKFDMEDWKGRACLKIPFYSDVRVLITDVTTPFMYRAHILEWFEDGRSRVNDGIKVISILLARYRPNGREGVRPRVVLEEELYIWVTGKTNYRVQVLHQDKEARTARVYLLDYGKCRDINVSELLELPPRLRTFPPQAVQVFVAGLRLVDRNPYFNTLDLSVVRDYIMSATLIGKVVFKVGGILWMDPLKIEYSPGKGLPGLSIKEALLKVKMVEENPEHIHLLARCANDLENLPDCFKYKSTGNCEKAYHGRFEKLTEEYTPVLLTDAKSPSGFYVRKAINESRLEQLLSDIENSICLGEIRWQGTPLLLKDVLLLARDNDKRWKRAKLLSVAPASSQSKICVFFLDSGYDREVWRSDILPMPVRFKDALPFQAIHCFMPDLEPCKPWKCRNSESLVKREEKEDEAVEKGLKHSGSELNSTESTLKPMENALKQEQKVLDSQRLTDEDDEKKGEKTVKDVSTEMSLSSISPVIKSSGNRVSGDVVEDDAHDSIKWRERSGDLLLSCTGTDIITAMMIESETISFGIDDNVYAVRLFDYNPGEHVGDVGQKLIMENEARITERALNGLFDAVNIEEKMESCDYKNMVMVQCKEFIRADEWKASTEIAENILFYVKECIEKKACRGLLHMLSIVLKYSHCKVDVEPVTKALKLLYSDKALSYYTNCREAEYSGLLNNICSQLYRITKDCSLEECQKGRHIAASLLCVLCCKMCAINFLKVGGMKALSFFILNDNVPLQERRVCLMVLGRLILLVRPPPPSTDGEGKMIKSTNQWMTKIECQFKIFTQLHQDLNSGPIKCLKNPLRCAKSDLLTLMETVADMVMHTDNNELYLIAILILTDALLNLGKDGSIRLISIQKLYMMGLLDSVMSTLKKSMADSEMVMKSIEFLLWVSRSDSFIRDHIKSLGLCYTVRRISKPKIHVEYIVQISGLPKGLATKRSKIKSHCDFMVQVRDGLPKALISIRLRKEDKSVENSAEEWIWQGGQWIRQGSGKENHGLGKEDQGLGKENHGLGKEDQGLGKENHGFGKEDHGSGKEDQGSGKENHGLGKEDQGSGKENHGLGKEDQGSGKENHGLGKEDQGLGKENHGFGKEDQGLGKENHGSGKENHGSGKEDQEYEGDYVPIGNDPHY